MATKFNKTNTGKAYLEYFKPAVSATGFEFRWLDEKPEAGLIDNRMRVEIRRSRF